jgi:hypothetical protein
MLWSLVAGAVAAVAVFVTTYMALKQAKQLTDVQDELIQAKDTQLATDLKDKDLKIAEARDKAATAESKAEGFRLDIAKADQRAAEANRLAEQEHLARVRIEDKLAGWKLDASAQTRIIQKLAPFKGTPFDLGANPSEMLFMEVVDGMLGSAGWNRQQSRSSNPIVNILLNGKARVNYVSGIYVEFAQSRQNDFMEGAGALVLALKSEGISAQGQMSPNEPDDTATHVVIGSK